MKIELQNQNDKKYVPNKETSLSLPRNQKIQRDTSIADLFDNYLRDHFYQDMNTNRALNNERPRQYTKPDHCIINIHPI